MRHSLFALTALAALTACQPKGAEKPRITEASVQLPAVSAAPAAGYFTLTGGRADDQLLRIDSAVVDKIELHESVMNGGVMTMRPLATVPVPAGAKVEFARGGKHAMLFGIDARITPGTGIPMLFTFASGTKVEIEAKTVAPGGGDDMGGMHH